VTDLIELTIGAVAHGGHCVAHAPDGRVVFVRHALPGEVVVAEVTEERRGYLRADAVSVLSASPDRVTPPCPYAGRCGGCDFQHATPAAQRELKAAVVVEQLVRLAGLSAAEVQALAVRVAELPGGPLGWRTRVRYAVDGADRVGLLGYRSHEVVPVDRCLIAHPRLAVPPGTSPDEFVNGVASGTGEVVVAGGPLGAWVHERAAGHEFSLPASAFWQVHPAAPDTLVGAVLDLLDPRPAERAWDLYGGVGLFAAALADRVAEVTLVESAPSALAGAMASLGDLRNVRIVGSTVERFRPGYRPDVVVLDPPRSGAGARVVRLIAGWTGRAVAYVACDPASFARDVATFRGLGWRLAALRAFDAFPMTHHLELVALLLPEGPGGSSMLGTVGGERDGGGDGGDRGGRPGRRG
jgi:tRNA/tmRNA/rRNA uracil-C5-methylase (TrmA/RlmC/RlmD family)